MHTTNALYGLDYCGIFLYVNLMSDNYLVWPWLAHVSGRPDKPSSTLPELLLSGSIPTSAPPSNHAGRTSGSEKTRDIERRIWGEGQHFVYFYVGRWIPRYGDFGLGYTEVAVMEGAASPWDSGAKFLSLISQFGEQEAVRRIKNDEIPVVDWRAEFAKHLKLNPAYLDSDKSDPDFLFEVRQKAPHPIAENLIVWCGSDFAVKAFRSLYAAKKVDSSIMAAFNDCLISGRGTSWEKHLDQAHAQAQKSGRAGEGGSR